MTRESQGIDIDYNRRDVEKAYGYGPWGDWAELVGWLQDEAVGDPRFGPGKVSHMVADLQQLAKDRVPFTDDPQEAFRLALSHRRPQ